MTLFEELKRRKVFRVAATYAVVAWILMQIGEVTFPALNIPDWVMSTLVVVLLAGFPIAVIFAWIFDRTPDGLVKTSEVTISDDNQDNREWYQRKSNYFIPIGIIFGLFVGVYGPGVFSDNSNNQNVESETQKLAILPFSNIRPDDETDFLGYALSDEIINRLGFLKSLIVRPATAVRQYRGKEVSPEKVGQELDVSLILTGSYLRDKNRLRLNTELMNISKKELVWSKSMTVDYDDIFAIQDSVANSIISEINAQPNSKNTLQNIDNKSSDPKAYELYLKAKSIGPVVISDYKRQLYFLKQSIDRDDKFAPSWEQMGFAYSRLSNFGTDVKENKERAENALLNALELNSSLRLAYGEIILLYTDNNRLIEAYSYALKALKMFPNDQKVNAGLSYGVRYAGLLKEAMSLMEKNISLETDPYEQAINMADIARVYFYMGKPDLGRQKFDEVLEFIESKGIETSSYLLFYDGLAYLYVGEIEKAIERFDEGFLLDPEQNFSLYGQIYKSIFLKDRSKAMELIRKLDKITIYDGEQYYRQIHFYSLLNMTKQAVKKMQGTVDRGFFPYPYFISDKFLDSIKSSAEYKDVLNKVQAKHIEFKTLFENTMDMNLLTDISS
tara:strand:- start:16 stop:1860 length:1845 start_codon:yes stop_codon:yes gene_type:complete